jgi:paraquat-inducible protein B
MNLTKERQSVSKLQTARVKQHGRLSPVWIIPLVAAALVAYLGYSSFANRGPELTLTLATADGLTVDQTQLKHKAVPLGTVSSIKLAPDMKTVVVKVRMDGGTKHLLTDKARFWVVKPRLTAGSLSGIETIVSGSYIEVDPGEAGGKPQSQFKALDQPPGRQSDEPGQVFVLNAKGLGSLGASSPIYFRDVEVGEVLSYDLGQGMGPVSMRIFIREPYDKFVHPQSRFWNASGLSITTGAAGMKVELQSLQTLLSGGIAFETPHGAESEPPAAENTAFELYDDKATADAAFYQVNLPYVTYFKTSVQGLTSGSPVQLFGVQVGSVTDVKLVYDPGNHEMVARVEFEIQPERILNKNERTANAPMPDTLRAAFAEANMRVVLESSSFLTGAKDLSIAFAPGKASGDLPREGEAVVLPSQGGGIDGLTSSLSDIASKLDKVPFEEIGQNANAALASVQHLANQIDTNTAPALAQLPAIADQLSQAAKNANGVLGADGYGHDSEFQRNMDRMMLEVNDAARSFRVLADYLDRHPESLIRGRASQGGTR